MNKKILILIPAYNEQEVIENVLQSIPATISGMGKVEVVVIDDGSSDKTKLFSQQNHVNVIHHVINRGLGAAICTGFTYAKLVKPDIVVTFDADGQHRFKDLPQLIKPIIDGRADVVIGSRLLKNSTMLFERKVVNWFSNILTFVFFGIWTTDSQSGLRAFSRLALNSIEIKTQRMEVSSEILKEINRNNLRLVEIPIPAIYTTYSLHKGQKISNATNVFIKLLLRVLQ